jgi:multidrug efflux pump
VDTQEQQVLAKAVFRLPASSANGLTAASASQGGMTGSPMTSDVLTSSAMTASGAQGPSPGIVRLNDVIDSPIVLGALNYNQYSSFDSHDAVGVSVFQLPGTNALTVADRVRARIKELEPAFPNWVKYTIGYDTTPYVRESIADVVYTLFLAVALVGVVVLLFLHSPCSCRRKNSSATRPTSDSSDTFS